MDQKSYRHDAKSIVPMKVGGQRPYVYDSQEYVEHDPFSGNCGKRRTPKHVQHVQAAIIMNAD